MKVILASKSPRRAALLDLAQIEYETFPSEFDEKLNTAINIEEKSQELAYGKALDVFNNTQGDRTIIGGDTFVVKNNKIYGKPVDRSDAIRILRELQGGTYSIYTSLAVLIEYRGEYKEFKEVHKTDITLVPMTDAEIIEYVDIDEPFDKASVRKGYTPEYHRHIWEDKAGAHSVQSCFAKFIERIEGNYMAAIGLPIDRVYKILKENEII